MFEEIGEYKVTKTIGQGAFSLVKLGVHTSTGQKVAIKIINKKMMAESNEKSNKEKTRRAIKKGLPLPSRTGTDNMSPLNLISNLENEVQLLMRLDHPNVIKTYKVIDSVEECYVVMQYASGGEMMEYLAVKSVLQEKEASKFFAQLVSGLEHIHLANIVHRDLKLENLLLDDKLNILISDFGLGRTFDNERVHLLDTFCGTPHYAAVELVSGIPYIGVKSDIWALGVILFYFVAGQAPFKGSTIAELYDNIKNVRYETNLVDLLDKILQKNPYDRITLDGIRCHPWLKGEDAFLSPIILPKISGKVDAAKLGQIVKSINNEKLYVTYTFNYHESTAVKKAPVETKRSRSNSLVVARRKSISVSGNTPRPILGEQWDLPSSPVSQEGSAITRVEEDLDTGRRSATLERPSIIEKVAIIQIAEDEEPSEVSSPFTDEKWVAPAHDNLKLPRQRRATTTVPPRKRSQTFSVASFQKDVMVLSESTNEDIGEEKQDFPTEMVSFSINRPSLKASEEFTFCAVPTPPASPVKKDSEDPSAKVTKSSMSVFARRLSMVGKPEDVFSETYKEDSATASMNLENFQLSDIQEWHEINRPPKSIRTVKFAFRKGTSSAVLDPSSMFQDLHMVIMAIPKLEFKRHPDYYSFICSFKDDGITESLRFEVEICKVWLLNVHAGIHDS